MSAVQSKITRYTKKQKNMNYDKGKNQSLETEAQGGEVSGPDHVRINSRTHVFNLCLLP